MVQDFVAGTVSTVEHQTTAPQERLKNSPSKDSRENELGKASQKQQEATSQLQNPYELQQGTVSSFSRNNINNKGERTRRQVDNDDGTKVVAEASTQRVKTSYPQRSKEGNGTPTQKPYELQQGISSSYSEYSSAKGERTRRQRVVDGDVTKELKEAGTQRDKKQHRQEGDQEVLRYSLSNTGENKRLNPQQQKPYELPLRVSSSLMSSENRRNDRMRELRQRQQQLLASGPTDVGPILQKERQKNAVENSFVRESQILQQSGQPRRQRPKEVAGNSAAERQGIQNAQKPRRQGPPQQQQQQQTRKSQQSAGGKKNEQGKSYTNPKASVKEPTSHQYSKSRENARSMQQERLEKRRVDQYKASRGKRGPTKSSGQSGKPSGCCLFFELFVDTTCNLICLAVVIVIAVVCGVVVYKLKTGKDAPLVPDVVNDIADGAIMNFEDLFKKGLVDKWQGNGTGEYPTSTWSHSRSGLTLDVHNALTSDWYPYFNQAMDAWANGHSPTSLVLNLIQDSPDQSCTPISDALVVCNANFGETGWKGINEVAVNGLNRIVQSVAKMNEFYLSGAPDGDKQYTMCHETGHGWGLGHQDEDFNNKDLGSCMDYVLDPENNQNPNDFDYKVLNETYGIVRGRKRNRYRRKLHLRSNGKSQIKAKPNPIFNISFTDESHRHKWRLLRRMRGMETHELDLGGGNRIRAHLLLSSFNG